MFVRSLGDYTTRTWKVENWWQPPAPAPVQMIPGVSNATTAVAAGGLSLAALAALAWYFMKK